MQRLLIAAAAGAAAIGLIDWAVLNDKTDIELPNSKLSRHGMPSIGPDIMHYESHSVHYDQARKVPLWSFERISRANLDGPANRKHSRFRPDDQVPALFRSSNGDYWHSGWSRGHMAPAGNNKHSQSAMDDTFFLTNIVPQDLDNNGGYWNLLETKCRDLAKERYEDVEIVSGPLWIPQDKSDGRRYMKYQVLGENDVAVPTHLYKIILGKNGTQFDMACFIVPNQPIPEKKPFKDFQEPLEKVERLSGISFFQLLNRSSVRDLCKIKGACDLPDAAQIILRWVDSARSLQSLEKAWQKAIAQGLSATPGLEEKYLRKKEEIKKTL
eukprot:m.21793 g.21793  ORF g.21793 m.21793 type:complete len:326 (+) comp28222_c0_seq1:54-1031(+)